MGMDVCATIQCAVIAKSIVAPSPCVWELPGIVLYYRKKLKKISKGPFKKLKSIRDLRKEIEL